jgi:hypothetical protein
LTSSDVAFLACSAGRFSSDNAVQDGLDNHTLTFGSLNPVGVEGCLVQKPQDFVTRDKREGDDVLKVVARSAINGT